MQSIQTVSENTIYVGASDRRLAKFENLFPIPRGVSYNAYVILDEKTALLDTADASVGAQFLENVAAALDGRKLDYLIVDHMEPDHAAMIEAVLVRWPDLRLVVNAKTLPMLKMYFPTDSAAFDDALVVKEGDTLDLGKHKLTFVMAPMVHWPEVMMTFDTTTGTLFSADAFGTFGALEGALFADEVDFAGKWLDDARRYYTNIVGKYGPQVQAVLKKAETLDIQMLLPLHGFVWREELGYLLGKYDLWSRYEPEVRGVMIAYASVYGGTENAANVLACRLAEQGVQVKMFDVSVTPAPYVVSDAFKYSHLVFASATYNMGIFVTMEDLLHDIAAHALADRRYALIENGTWSPASGKKMDALLSPLKGWSAVEPVLTVKSALRPDQAAQMQRLADAIAADVKAEQTEEDASGEGKHRYVCKVCGYVYEGDELPADYKCPLCGAGPEYFRQEA